MSKKNNIQSIIDEATLLINNNKTKIKDLYEHIMSFNRSNIAFIYRHSGVDNYITYKEYDELVKEYSSKLNYQLKEIEKHSIIGIKLDNSPKFCIVLFATLMAGYKPLLLDYKLDIDSTNKLLNNGLAKAIITDKNDYNAKTIKIDFIEDEKLNINDDDFEDEILFCSSGTTGVSKQVIFNGANLIHQLEAAKNMPLENLDIIYVNKKNSLRNIALIPFHHIFAFMAILLWYSFYNSTLVFVESKDPREILKAIKELKVTHIYHVPLFYEVVAKNLIPVLEKRKIKNRVLNLYKKDKYTLKEKIIVKNIRNNLFGNQIKYLISGGGKLNEETSNLFNGLNYLIHDGYGMTEVGVTSVELSMNKKDIEKVSIGKPLYNVIYKINENNELLIKSPITHIKEIVDKKIVDTKLEDGYFKSGDIASFDNDNRYYLKGRLKDVIITSNGENVFPEEIESSFLKIKEIIKTCVFQDGNEIILVINGPSSCLNEVKKINETLPINKQVNKILFTDLKFPLSSSMKIKRFEVINNYHNGLYKIEKNESNNEIFDNLDKDMVKNVKSKLNDIYKNVLNIDSDVDDNAHWINDLHSDSMSYVSLISDIENKFNIKIEIEKYGKLTTLNEFAKEIIVKTSNI